MDYAEYGGSVLLGLDGTVVKAHGGSMLARFILRFDKLKLLAMKRLSIL